MNYKENLERVIKELEEELENIRSNYEEVRDNNINNMDDQYGNYDITSAVEEDRLRDEVRAKEEQIERFNTALEEVNRITEEMERVSATIDRNRQYREEEQDPTVKEAYTALISSLESKQENYRNELDNVITPEISERLENSNENVETEEVSVELSDEDKQLITELLEENLERLQTELEEINNEYEKERDYAAGSMDNEYPELEEINERLLAKQREIEDYTSLIDRNNNNALTNEDYELIGNLIDQKVETSSKEKDRLSEEYDRESEYAIGSMDNEYPELNRINEELIKNQKDYDKYNKLKDNYDNFKENELEEPITEEVENKKQEIEDRLDEKNAEIKDFYPPMPIEMKDYKPIKITPEQKEAIDKNKETLRLPGPTEEKRELKSTEYMISELLQGLDLSTKRNKDNKKYTYGNIQVGKNFVNDLHTGNYTYNIVGFVKSGFKAIVSGINKLRSKITTTIENKEVYEELKKRINELPEEDFLQIINEYKGNNAIAQNQPLILNTMLGERYAEYTMKKVAEINKEITEIHTTIYNDMNRIKTIDHILENGNLSDEEKLQLIENRKQLLSGKAELIATLREKQITGNNLLSGNGLHAFQEEMKAVATKMNVVGFRWATNKAVSPELRDALAELDKGVVDAINENDDQKALVNFVSYEQMSINNTEIKNSIVGKRSVGERYYDPLIHSLDYKDDPFIRDLFTTIAVVGSTVATIKSIQVAAHNKAVADAHNREIADANAQNQGFSDQVHDTAGQIYGTKSTMRKGIKAQGHSDVINASNVYERRGLDKADWNIGTETYRVADAKTHSVIEKLGNDISKDWSKIQSAKGAIGSQDLINIATKYNNEFIKSINEALPIAKSYANAHPSIELDGIIQSMTYLQKHPHAIIDMNAASLNNIELAHALEGLSATKVNAISGLESDLQSMLMQNGAVGLMLLRSYQSGKELESKYGKTYGNVVTEMINDSIENEDEYDYKYIDSIVNGKEENNEPTITEETEQPTPEPVEETEEPEVTVVQEPTVYDVYNEIVRLNPNGEFQYIEEPTMAPDGSIVQPNTIFTDIKATDLKLPEGFYYNDKNGITNKHNSNTGQYITIQVREFIEEKENNVEEYDIDPMFEESTDNKPIYDVDSMFDNTTTVDNQEYDIDPMLDYPEVEVRGRSR